MTDQEQIAKLNQQMDRMITLIEQQYTAIGMLRQRIENLEKVTLDMQPLLNSQQSYIAGQLDRNSGR